MKGLRVQKALGYSKRQFSFLSEKKMTACLTGIKLRIFKSQKKENFWVTHWTHCRKFGASWALPVRSQIPNVLTVHRGIGHHFRRGRCLSHAINNHRRCTYTHSWMDDRIVNPPTFNKQEHFQKVFQAAPCLFHLYYLGWSLSHPYNSFGQQQPLPNWFPCPETHSPQKCSPHSPESNLKLKSIFSSTKNLSTVPWCLYNKNQATSQGIENFLWAGFYSPPEHCLPTQPPPKFLPPPLHSNNIDLFVIPTTPYLKPPYLHFCCFLCLMHFSIPSSHGELHQFLPDLA